MIQRTVHALAVVLLVATFACRSSNDGRPPAAERAAIADTLRHMMAAATDLSRPGAYERMLALYADTGRVVSAGGGGLTASRDTVAMQLRAFWQDVGQNMRQPRWEWRQTFVDVLSPNAAVLTATYRVPHLTPQGTPHVIGGVWTAVFERRGGRWVIVQEHLSDVPGLAQDSTAVQDEHAMHRDST